MAEANNNLKISLSLDSSQYAKGLKDAVSDADKFVKTITSIFDKMPSALQTAASNMMGEFGGTSKDADSARQAFADRMAKVAAERERLAKMMADVGSKEYAATRFNESMAGNTIPGLETQTPGWGQQMAKSAAASYDVFRENDYAGQLMTESEWQDLWDKAERKFAETVAAKQAEAVNNAVQNGTKYFSQITAGDYLKNAYAGSGKSASESASVFQGNYDNLPTSGSNWAWGARGNEVFTSQFQESGKSAKESAAVFEEAFSQVDASAKKLLGDNLGEKFASLFNANQAEKFGKALNAVAVGAEKAGVAMKLIAKTTPFPYMAKQLKELKKPLDNFVRSLKRIVMYRIIRGGLTAVLQNWREGFKNLYQYSVQFGTQFRHTMDSLATDMQFMANGFAAMVAPIANAVAPAIQAIADKVVALANAVGYFFAKVLGQSSFSAAVRAEKKFQDVGGAAKEAKKQLMGFDELNVLTAPSGGGGAGADYGKMFEEWETTLEEGSLEARIREAIENQDWEGLGSLMAEKMNGLVQGFKESDFGSNLGKKFQKGLSIAHGFLTKFSFKNAGSAVAVNLNNAIANIDWYELGATLNAGITGAFDFVLGFIEDFDWGQFAESFSNVIKGWFDHLSDWIASVDWVSFGQTFFDKVYEFITGIDFGGIATSFFTLLGQELIGLFGIIEGFLGEMWTKWNEYCGIEADDSGIELVGKFLLGIWNGLVGIATWVYDNVVTPFFNALRGKKGFGLDEEGGETEETGKDVIKSFLDGLKLSWEDVKTWVTEKVTWFKNQLKGMKDWLLDGLNGNGTYKWTPSMEAQSLKYKMAEGGTVPTGQLFIANEAGPELVGSVGGKTTVTSQDQFTAGMADIMDVTNTVILQAAQSLMQTIQNKNMTAVAVIGDRDVVRSYDRGKTLAGGSLVE